MSSTLYRTLWRRGKASLDRVYRLSEMDPCRMDLEKVIQVYQVWFDIFGNFARPRSLEKYLNFQHLLYAKRMLKNQTIYAWKNMEYAYLHFAQNFLFLLLWNLCFFSSCKICAIPFVFVWGGCFIEIYAARAGSITSRAGSVINGEVQVISGALIISSDTTQHHCSTEISKLQII